MNKTKNSMLLSVLIAAAAFIVPFATARADCAKDVEVTQETLNKADINTPRKREAIQSMLDRARDKYDQGKKKGCKNIVEKAKQKIAADTGSQ